MRGDETDEEAPGTIITGRLALLEPTDRALDDGFVIVGVFA